MPYTSDPQADRDRLERDQAAGRRSPSEDPIARQAEIRRQGVANQRQATGGSDPTPLDRYNVGTPQPGSARDRTEQADRSADQYQHPGWN